MPAEAELNHLLGLAGLTGPATLQALKGGWNHRVFCLMSPSGPLLLKQYRPDDAGLFPRQEQEFRFGSHAYRCAPEQVPQPLACDRSTGLSLFRWVEGEAYLQPDSKDVVQALDFICQLQHQAQEAGLPDAAECCHSLEDHLLHLDRRLARLQTMEVRDELHAQAQAFVAQELLPGFQHTVARVRARLMQQPELNQRLSAQDLCLSPSDFGFHNALKTARGPVFLDFEYAGWDDPAQLVCDFYAQFEVPAPKASYRLFAAGLAALFAEPDWHLERMQLMRPVHVLKWVCIALNHFCPHKSSSRQFARRAEPDQLQRQLQKAVDLLAQI